MMLATIRLTVKKPPGGMATSIWVKAATGTHPWPSIKSAYCNTGNEETAGGRRYTVPSVKSTSKFGLAGTGANVAIVKRGRWPNEKIQSKFP